MGYARRGAQHLAARLPLAMFENLARDIDAADLDLEVDAVAFLSKLGRHLAGKIRP